MDLETLIIDFGRLNDEIAAAAQNDDDVRLQQLDADIQVVFEHILNFAPKSNAERVAHCSFLLENLIPSDKRQGASDLICEKILQMVSRDDSSE